MSSGAFLFCGAKRFSTFFEILTTKKERSFMFIAHPFFARSRECVIIYKTDSFCLLFLLHDTNTLFSMLDFIA